VERRVSFEEVMRLLRRRESDGPLLLSPPESEAYLASFPNGLRREARSGAGKAKCRREAGKRATAVLATSSSLSTYSG
jgi:hypothetical protein